MKRQPCHQRSSSCGLCPRSLRVYHWVVASITVISTVGCSTIQSISPRSGAPKTDVYASNQFTSELEQVGWLWPQEDGCYGPVPYVPREGDLIFTSSRSFKQTFVYLAFGHIGLPHHVMLVFKKSDGCMAALEVGSGGDRSVAIRALPKRLTKHKELYEGSTIAVRQIRRPLTAEESYQLTCFAEGQVGKPFSSRTSFLFVAMPGRVAPESSNGQPTWFCSELIAHALRECGLLVGSGRPRGFAPEDLYLDERYDLSHLWVIPQDWTCDTNPNHLRPVFDPDLRL